MEASETSILVQQKQQSLLFSMILLWSITIRATKKVIWKIKSMSKVGNPYMTRYFTAGMLEIAPSANAKDDVRVERRIVPPMSFMVSLTLSTPLLVWSVREKEPEIMNAASRPTPLFKYENVFD